MTDQTERPLADVIEELRGLLAKATPGPWSVSGVRARAAAEPVLQILGGDGKCYALVFYSDRKPGEHAASYADANLIVALRNNANLLLSAASRVSAPAFDPQCRHGCRQAVGLYSLPQGCPCFDDKEQWLCEQHLVKLRQNLYTAIPIFERPLADDPAPVRSEGPEAGAL